MKTLLTIGLFTSLIFAVSLRGQNNLNEITILFDNYVHNPDTKSGWGFSCLVSFNGSKVLFDAGGDEIVFASNVTCLEIDISDINSVVFSHEHGDHIAGLNYILASNDNLKIYVLASFSTKFEDRVKEKNGELIRVKSPLELYKGIFLTGEMGDQIKEQSMILDTDKGLVIITGCSHPGIVNILKKAKEMLNKNIHMVLGGFHLSQHSPDAVKEIIQQFKYLGVEQCGATHCTGEKQIGMFRDFFGKNFIELGTGKKITF
jgi:7,8-dihydropterin-6-yl-methyl-4-(beta-D-ribofuranosyl)aminobenzene 5'-phosphate synthase